MNTKRLLMALLAILLTTSSALATIYKGSCGADGDNVTYTLDTETGLLQIEGSGAMKNYSSSNAPWRSYQDYITKIDIFDGITSIGSDAFFECSNLTSITIPNSVTSIGEGAFYGCFSITSINIPSSVTSIGNSAFCDCNKLKEVHISDIANWCPLNFNDVNANPLKNGAGLYLNGQLVQDLVVPEGVTSIGVRAFDQYEMLKSVSLPNSIVELNDYCFAACTSLIQINIPNSVTAIPYGICAGCSNLKEVSIGNSVSSIGNGAFWGCTKLTSITLPSSLTNMDVVVFHDCTGIDEIKIYCTTPPTAHDNTFEGMNHTKCVVRVLPESLDAYRAAVGWRDFTNIIPFVSVDLADGTPYDESAEIDCDFINYTRTFTNTDWQALYVPFGMNYEDWADDFEVAAINDVHQWDDDDDGNIDRTALEVVKVKSGSIEPNTPYLIKAKTTGEKTITLSDATLYASEENTFDVSSWKLRFNFFGTYTGVAGSTMLSQGYYAMGGGKLQQAESSANALSPMRWYMSVTDRQGNPVGIGLIKVMVFGEDEDWDDAETAITNINKSDSEAPLYDLSGRRVEKAKKGLYIKNGKKVLVK